MPASGTSAKKSYRYSQVLNQIVEQRNAAKKLLTDLRKQKNKEDRRHRRLMKSAGKLDAKDLMELAGIKQISLGNLAQFCTELGVDASGVTVASSGSVPASSVTPVITDVAVGEVDIAAPTDVIHDSIPHEESD